MQRDSQTPRTQGRPDEPRARRKHAPRSRYLTVAWNNTLTLVLGLAVFLFAIAALSTSALSDRAAFAGAVLLGAFY